jgi:hypothetical protein
MSAEMARKAHDLGKVYTLEYYTDQGPRSVEVFMLRHRERHTGEDDGFTVHDAESGRILGDGDAKKDAESAARCALHQHFDFGIPLPPLPSGGG